MTGNRDRRRVRRRTAGRAHRAACGHWVEAADEVVSRNRGPWRCLPCALATRGALTVGEVLRSEARR